jgi:hypothetical protein
MGDHRDHLAEYNRARRLGLVRDDVWYSAVSIESMLRDEASA